MYRMLKKYFKNKHVVSSTLSDSKDDTEMETEPDLLPTKEVAGHHNVFSFQKEPETRCKVMSTTETEREAEHTVRESKDLMVRA